MFDCDLMAVLFLRIAVTAAPEAFTPHDFFAAERQRA